MAAPRKRLTREESKAVTQEKLLVAAAKAFARHGFAGVAVEDIAEAAGFSRGAFYSNFKNKDVIFLALVEHEVKMWTRDIQEILAGTSSAEETLGNLRKFYGAISDRDRDAHLLIAEAQLYAARNSQFRNKLNALFRQIHEELKTLLQRFQEQTGHRDPVAADQLALIGISLGHGLTIHNLIDPKHYPDQMVTACMELVFDKVIGPK
jgi:AcrR family transcriptional regulator